MAEYSHNALVVRVDDGQPPRLSKENIPTPSPAANQVLVKISHAAQNPTDGMPCNDSPDGLTIAHVFQYNPLMETRLAAELSLDATLSGRYELGRDVIRFTKGDIIAGLVWGGEIKGLGAYGQYCLADDRISFKVPVAVRREHASTVPLASCTAWLALFSGDCLGLDRSRANGTSVLVWGGSSSVGLYAIQIASIFGLDVVTTCSPKHADLVRSYGAKYVFDYKDERVIEKIHEVAPNLKHAFDTIGNLTSSTIASHAFCKGPRYLCTVRPGKANTENVAAGTIVSDVLVWTAFPKDHSYGEFKWPYSKEDYELGSELFDKLHMWLENSTIKPSNSRLFRGLDPVEQGFQEYRDGKISAYKIVYEL